MITAEIEFEFLNDGRIFTQTSAKFVIPKKISHQAIAKIILDPRYPKLPFIEVAKRKGMTVKVMDKPSPLH